MFNDRNMFMIWNVCKKLYFWNVVIFWTIELFRSDFFSQIFQRDWYQSSTLKNVIIWILITWSWYGAIRNYNVKSNKILPLRHFLNVWLSSTCAMRIQFQNSLEHQIHSLSTKQQMFQTEPNIFWRRDD